LGDGIFELVIIHFSSGRFELFGGGVWNPFAILGMLGEERFHDGWVGRISNPY
jgi:hypothetical protein